MARVSNFHPAYIFFYRIKETEIDTEFILKYNTNFVRPSGTKVKFKYFGKLKFMKSKYLRIKINFITKIIF